MIERIVTSVVFTLTKSGPHYEVYRRVTYVESTIAAGTTRQIHEQYDGLTVQERDDVLLMLLEQLDVGSAIHVVGGTIVAQPSLFD